MVSLATQSTSNHRFIESALTLVLPLLACFSIITVGISSQRSQMPARKSPSNTVQRPPDRPPPPFADMPVAISMKKKEVTLPPAAQTLSQQPGQPCAGPVALCHASKV